jgi:tRNA (uracil-5-)-methyltransferase TRM9
MINEDDYVRNIYNEIGNHFDVTRTYNWSWIIEFTQFLTYKNVVYDIGCGSGRNLKPYPNWIGFDNCDTFISICKKKHLNVIKTDMTELPVKDNSADAILCIASFHHLSNEKRRIEALNEMKRVLQNNGEILLSVWSINQPKKTRRNFEYGDNIVTWNKYGKIYKRYYYIFKKCELETLFQKCGLKIKFYKWDCGNEVYVLCKNNNIQ